MGCSGCNSTNKIQVPKAALRSPQYDPKDSSITFPDDVEKFEVAGYEVDPDDDRRLVSNMPPCLYRITGVMMKRDSTFTAHHVCTGPCEHKTKPVSYDICSGCPLKSGQPDGH